MNPLPNQREILTAFLSLEFEFVPVEQWQVAWNRLMDGSHSDFDSALPSECRLQASQRATIEQLIHTWEQQSIDLEVKIRKFATQLISNTSANSRLASTSLNSDTIENLHAIVANDPNDHSKGAPVETLKSDDSLPSSESGTDRNCTTAIGSPYSVSNSYELAESIAKRTINHIDPPLSEDSRYEVIEVLDEGGLGKILIAHDHQLSRKVAFKQIKEQFAVNDVSQRRFVFEAAITGQLEHPGIVPVYSLGRDQNNSPYYAMRLIEGESFHKVIQRFHRLTKDGISSTDNVSIDSKHRRLEFRQLLKRFLDLCEAVDFAHSRGVIHRDLKPANIMIGAFGETFVVDWGLARHFDDTSAPMNDNNSTVDNSPGQTRQGTIVGTPAYMSPDQARGEVTSLGATSDIFSLGSILFNVMTGKKPFEHSDSRSTIQAVAQGEFSEPIEIRSDIPKPLNAICIKAMQFEPADRYQSAGALAQDIERWLADEPVEAWKEPLLNRAGRWVRNHRTLVTTAVAFLFVSTIALAVIGIMQQESNRKLFAANEKEKEATQRAVDANKKLIAANEKEKEATRLANEQFELAEQRFQLALDAVGQYHNEVSRDFLLGQAEFNKLRANLLSAPREFYRKLTESLQQDSQISSDQQVALIDAYLQMGSLADKMNESSDAMQAYKNALANCEKLLQSNENSDDMLRTKGRILSWIAAVHREIGEYEQSKEHYNQALEILEQVLTNDPNNRQSRERLSTARSQLGTVLATQNKPDPAIEQIKLALEHDRFVVEKFADNGSKQQLAVTLNLLSNVYADKNDIANSIATAEEGLVIFKELMAEGTEDSQLIHEVSGNLTNLAYMYQQQKRFDEALELYDESENAYRVLVAKAPNIIRFRIALASTLNNMGLLFVDLDDREQAESYYEQSLKIKEQLVVDYPQFVDLASSLGGGYVNFGGYFHGLGQFQTAVSWYSKGVETLELLLKKNPSHAQANLFLLNARANRLRAYRRLEDHDKAIQDADFLLQNETDQKKCYDYQIQKAQALALSGKHEQAHQISLELQKDSETDGDFFNLAFIDALAVEAARNQETVDTDKQETAISTYAKQAVKNLESMYKTRALSQKEFLDLLTNNPYLKPLHDDPGFQEFRKTFE
jgi:eukaryotic-like serine/threonine-protein kinase